MCSGQRTEIGANSLKCEIRENLLYAKQGRKAERWTKFQKKNPSQVCRSKSRWCVWDRKCTGLGDGLPGAKQCYRKARILSGIV